MNSRRKQSRVVDRKRRLLVAAFIVVAPFSSSSTAQASTAPQTGTTGVPPVNSAAANFDHQENLAAAATAASFPGSSSTLIGGSTGNGGNGPSPSDDELESSSDDFEEGAERSSSEGDDEDDEQVALQNNQQGQMIDEATELAAMERDVLPPVVELVEEETVFDNELTDDPSGASPSQPLKTLKKLQQMLDETDYMTTTTSAKRKVKKSIKPRSQQPSPPGGGLASEQSSFERQQYPQESSLPPPPMPPQFMYDPNQSSETNPGGYMQPQQFNEQQPPPPMKPEKPVSPVLPEKISSKQLPQSKQQQQAEQVRQLWTSKDRSKYKKMQQMQRRADEERRRLEQNLLLQPNSSDDEGTDEGVTDTDDGLMSYTLPNLPIYMSDAEGEGSDSGDYHPQVQLQQQPQPQPAQSTVNPTSAYPQQRQQELYAYAQQQQQQQQQAQYGYPRGQYPPPPHDPQMQPPPYMAYPNAGYAPYPPNMPYAAYNPQQQQYSQQQQQQQQQQHMTPQQQQQHQQMLASQYAAAWAYYPRPSLRIPPSHAQAATKVAPSILSPVTPTGPASFEQQQQQQQQLTVQPPEVATSLAEASSQVNFDSIQKLALLGVALACLAYSAVSPRHLPLAEYNSLFYDNLRLVALAGIAPMVNFLLVCDARENDVNSVITSFYTSFTVGYCLAFVLEILLTTGLRLGVFACWEPNIFKLSPKVPRLVLPWVVRENKYRPKRITLFAADFLTSCVASPIVEEFVKLKILQLSVRLPRNFIWYTKVSTSSSSKNKKKRKRRVAEAATKNPGEPEITNINSYVTHMLAVSTGLKLCDSARRILMYTKAKHLNKSFYAFVRGMFPIHELCGTMTALALAKRDVLGVDMPVWKMLLPSVVIHGMANFKGMKPIYKWNAATPWSEMQLSPWHAADDSTFPQLVNKGFAKLMWLIILARVLGYCIKNYYLISRQARKRTTTYAGKQAAFSAELAAAEMLKKTKDKKK